MSGPRTRKLAIIGAGPAGTTLALELVRLGVDPGDLVVYDKAAFPRPKLCGGGITVRGTELLGEILGEPPGGARTVRLQFRCELGRFDVRERGPQWLQCRTVLDTALLEACRARGVEIRESAAVTELEPGLDGWRVKTRGSTESFAWVAGADGASGLSRRASGLPAGITGRLVEGVFEGDPELFPRDMLVFDFDPVLDGIPGYAWIFAYPKPHADHQRLYKVGVMDGRGRVPGDALRRWTLRFAEQHGLRPLELPLPGWPERYYDASVRAHRPGLVLVGEAHGIDPLLGEGIAPAMFMARYAAERLRAALDAGASRISGYERGFLTTEEGRNLWFQSKLANLLYGPRPHRWLRVLFEMEHLHALASGGTDAYGRLARHIPALAARYAWQVARKGAPSAAPIRRAS